ncbi:MAG TPA: class I SAM-dependent methyltransferase [Thermoanaerobaculia bacterium]|nr:class I SAM-dependent methyltransferase [Thermoanaerobaculia bacterium]
MPSLVILEHTSPSADASPEMEYLRSFLALQGRRAFGAVERVAVRIEGTDEPRLPERFDAALVVGPADLLVGQRSLQAMAARLAAGAECVVPVPLSAAGLDGPVYTLRGYERFEERFLAATGPPAASSHAGSALPPVALLRPEALRRRMASASLAEVVAEPAACLESDRAGLCHVFVDYYGEVRSDVAPFLPEDARHVLEVGCARGRTGEWLQRERGVRVTGVELNPAVAREAAGRLHRVVVGDVEDAGTVERLEPPPGGFDALLALELFEHLVAPESFLEQARRLVRPGGRIVLSVPNVGHWSVAEDLLAGRWDYLPIGLLCYTHYRFFTRATLADWLGRCGFERFRLVPQTTEPPPWLGDTGALATDAESLATKGFYVVIDVGAGE